MEEDQKELRFKRLTKFDEQFGARDQIVGIDEVGVGPFAGPLVACALILKSTEGLAGVDDSKALSELGRERLYSRILRSALEFQLGIVPAHEVDGRGTHVAASIARDRAFRALRSRVKVAIVDGDSPHDFRPTKCESIPQADSKSLVVAAASILAKVSRDRMMVELAESYPGYDWASNKGYGTPKHQEAIKKLGLTPYHRLSFDPLKKIAKSDEKEERTNASVIRSLRRRARA